MGLFRLFYREGQMPRQGVVEARDEEFGEAVGRKWCRQELGRQFIRVEAMVLADEGILAVEERQAVGLDNFEDLSVHGAMAAVMRGDLAAGEAYEREGAGKNRKSLMQWLEGKMGDERLKPVEIA